MNLKFMKDQGGTFTRMLLPLFSLILAGFTAKSQTVVATYTSGDIPTWRYTVNPTVTTSSSCPGTLSVTIPAGNWVTGMAVTYDMTAANGGFQNEQRSYLYSPTLNAGETTVSMGGIFFEGTYSYSRAPTFANGATGTFSVELHALREYGDGFGTCNTTYNKVDNNTWVLTVSYAPVPLKIMLSDISAANHGAVNNVSWKTQSEETGDRFDVERSIDGRSFILTATVDAKGTAPAQYNYTDEKPYPGTTFYRLKMVDKDGRTSYSKTVTAEMKASGFMLHAFPNPVNNELTVRVSGGISGKGQVALADVTGRPIRKFTVDQSGVLEIPMTDLNNGVYLLQYEDGSNKQTLKINKH